MPDENPPSPKREPPRSPADLRWRSAGASPRTASHGPGAKRRSRGLLLAGVLLALVSLVIVWLLYVHPVPAEPLFLSINIGDYNSRQLPIVPFARQDSERLRRHFVDSRNAESKTKDLLMKELGRLATFSAKPVVVHIAALGQIQGDKVFLLPVDADPDDPSTWLPVQTVLDAVGRCPAPKLFILDLAQPGPYGPRLAENLEKQLRNAPPKFLVLLPCSAGQSSSSSEILQGSVFSHYLDMGLQGEADSKNDQAVTVKELFGFVEGRVDHWSRINRGRRQQPLLLGQGDDFTLIDLKRSFTPKEIEVPARDYPEPLKKAWESRDAWQTKNNLPPEFLLSLDAQLLHQEERWHGGAEPGEMKPGDIFQKAKDDAKTFQAPAFPPLSLAMVVPKTKANQELSQSLQVLLAKVGTAEKKEDVAKLQEAIAKKLEEPKDADFPQRAACIIEALCSLSELNEAQLRFAVDLLQLTQAGHAFVETIYLQRLLDRSERLKDIGWDWKPALFPQVLKTMRAREAVIAGLARDPSLLRWTGTLFDEAEADRQAGERVMLWQKPSTWPGGKQTLAVAEAKYDRVRRLIDSLRHCQIILGEALVLLPSYLPLLTDWPEYDAQAVDLWKKSAQETEQLAKNFPDATGKGNLEIGPTTLAYLETASNQLEKDLRDLREILRQGIERAEAGDGADVLEQVFVLQRISLLTMKERESLNKRALQLAKSLQERTDKEDRGEASLTPVSALSRPRQALDPVKLRTDLEKALGSLPKSSSLLSRTGQWKQFAGWLAERYRREEKFLSAEDARESPEIVSFFRNAARDLGRLDVPGP